MQATNFRPNHAYAKYSNVHGAKRALVGPPRQVPPAWRTQAPVAAPMGAAGKGRIQVETGSKIFLSRLPVDVGEKEVEELFKKTIGPLKESFLIYNSQGRSKGMAVVVFQRPSDAALAKTKYDGKIVDGRRPIRIEIITDGPAAEVAPVLPQTPSLLNRMGVQVGNGIIAGTAKTTAPTSNPIRFGPPDAARRPKPAAPTSINVTPATVPPRRVRTKKGPKRLKKLQQQQQQQPKKKPLTRDDLDKEMDDYLAAAPRP
ncbi:hypothetical protein BDQ12DRAFT_606703 [Crucibulum laeve]|uniref:RRM domain-containing protein n=1 Tax=Crucibulum laeve TaxID=68775 RepID=A0A5C3LYR8_9AGAR|nr:hypothetical protein BDQ12DRAFT_606703 [Crucibulum laeve]